jgi:lipid II:glycine glycyltransferase (peptidoglycan interpeptide bridge formation enzyme)
VEAVIIKKMLNHNFKIVTLKSPKKLREWDKFVDNSPQGSIFHKSYWLNIFSDNFEVCCLEKEGEIFAGLPLIGQNFLGFKIVLNFPSIPWLGPIYKKSNAKYASQISNHKQINRLFAQIIRKRFDFFVMSFSPLIIDIQPYLWEGFSSEIKYTYRIQLSNLDSIWKAMDSSRRRNIRRAQKDKVKVVLTNDFGQVFKIVQKTFRRQDKNIRFKNQAYKINKVLSKKGQSQGFLAVNSEGKKIAAVYIVWDNKTAYYFLGGYDNKDSHHGAVSLALWEAIKYSREKLNLKVFDFEGSMIQPIERFFRKFGGEIKPRYVLMYNSKKGFLLKLGYWLLKNLK